MNLSLTQKFDLLQDTLTQLQTNPTLQLDMQTFGEHRREPIGELQGWALIEKLGPECNKCGTVACFAGWAVVLHPEVFAETSAFTLDSFIARDPTTGECNEDLYDALESDLFMDTVEIYEDGDCIELDERNDRAQILDVLQSRLLEIRRVFGA